MLPTWPLDNVRKSISPVFMEVSKRTHSGKISFCKSQPSQALAGFDGESCNGEPISSCLSRVLPSEVEVLESIYLDELQVVKGNGRYVFN